MLSRSLLLALAASAGSSPVSAQAALVRTPAPAPAVSAIRATHGPALDTTTLIRFDIPAGPLEDALRAFTRMAGIEVELPAGVSGSSAPALAGTLTSAAALRALLAGTDLRLEFNGTERVSIIDPATENRPVYTLAPLTVIGRAGRSYATQRTRTATKTDTPLRDAPQSITVITRDAMQDQGMAGLTDVVRYVPGVTMGQGEGHRDAPTMRGNGSTADFFVDGVRDDAQYFRDVYNVERVEALKGSNAMIFGRGGGGGVLNRVSKLAGWTPSRAVTASLGSFDYRRFTADLGDGVLSGEDGSGFDVAYRLNGVFEDSRGFREHSALERLGINPTVAVRRNGFAAHAGYEYFDDDRTIDRGVPSFNGRPSRGPIATYFGNPDSSYGTVKVHAGSLLIEQAFGGDVLLRNRSRYADYNKFYQNSFPGAVSADGSTVTLSAYSNATDRRNLINQTDLTFRSNLAGLGHQALVGAEFGLQRTQNFRNTGYYGGTSSSFSVPFDNPTITSPVEFRQSSTDANNSTEAVVSALYVQDQITFSPMWEAVAGVRYERFDIDFENRRTGDDLARTDGMLSPRVGLIFKPLAEASVYGSFSVSHLPGSGDQFTSLTEATKGLEPEAFRNYELGAKWDPRSNLSLTAAAYRLDRTNTSAPDPADPSKRVQTGSQRTSGVELSAAGSVTGAWQVIGAAAYQEAEVVTATASAQPGTTVPLVPRMTASLWNRYQVLPWLGAGLGVVSQSEMYAAIDNSVTLPGFTRVDGALFLRTGSFGVQMNVENVLDRTYYATSHGNNNIMPGAPRTVRLTVSTR